MSVVQRERGPARRRQVLAHGFAPSPARLPGGGPVPGRADPAPGREPGRWQGVESASLETNENEGICLENGAQSKTEKNNQQLRKTIKSDLVVCDCGIHVGCYVHNMGSHEALQV